MKCFGHHVTHQKQNLWDTKQSSNKKDVLCSTFSNKKEVISALKGRIRRSNLRHFREGVQIEMCCSLVRSNLSLKSSPTAATVPNVNKLPDRMGEATRITMCYLSTSQLTNPSESSELLESMLYFSWPGESLDGIYLSHDWPKFLSDAFLHCMIFVSHIINEKIILTSSPFCLSEIISRPNSFSK